MGDTKAPAPSAAKDARKADGGSFRVHRVEPLMDADRGTPRTDTPWHGRAGSGWWQPALEVGRFDDPFEAEAERLATEAVYARRWTPSVPDDTDPCGTGRSVRSVATANTRTAPVILPVSPSAGSAEHQARTVARMLTTASPSNDNAGPTESTRALPVHRAADVAGPRGLPIDPRVRARVERAFDVGLPDVRLHVEPAERLRADRLGTRAFTQGADVWLGTGVETSDHELITHELVHAVQQLSAGTLAVQCENDPGYGPLNQDNSTDPAVVAALFELAATPGSVALQLVQRCARRRFQVEPGQIRPVVSHASRTVARRVGSWLRRIALRQYGIDPQTLSSYAASHFAHIQRTMDHSLGEAPIASTDHADVSMPDVGGDQGLVNDREGEFGGRVRGLHSRFIAAIESRHGNDIYAALLAELESSAEDLDSVNLFGIVERVSPGFHADQRADRIHDGTGTLGLGVDRNAIFGALEGIDGPLQRAALHRAYQMRFEHDVDTVVYNQFPRDAEARGYALSMLRSGDDHETVDRANARLKLASGDFRGFARLVIQQGTRTSALESWQERTPRPFEAEEQAAIDRAPGDVTGLEALVMREAIDHGDVGAFDALVRLVRSEHRSDFGVHLVQLNHAFETATGGWPPWNYARLHSFDHTRADAIQASLDGSEDSVTAAALASEQSGLYADDAHIVETLREVFDRNLYDMEGSDWSRERFATLRAQAGTGDVNTELAIRKRVHEEKLLEARHKTRQALAHIGEWLLRSRHVTLGEADASLRGEDRGRAALCQYARDNMSGDSLTLVLEMAEYGRASMRTEARYAQHTFVGIDRGNAVRAMSNRTSREFSARTEEGALVVADLQSRMEAIDQHLLAFQMNPIPANVHALEADMQTLAGMPLEDQLAVAMRDAEVGRIQVLLAQLQQQEAVQGDRATLMGQALDARTAAVDAVRASEEYGEQRAQAIASAIGTAVTIAAGLALSASTLGVGAVAAAAISTALGGVTRVVTESALSPNGFSGPHFHEAILNAFVEVGVAVATAGISQGLTGEIRQVSRAEILRRVRTSAMPNLQRLLQLENGLARRTPALFGQLVQSGGWRSTVGHLGASLSEAFIQTVAGSATTALTQGTAMVLPDTDELLHTAATTLAMHGVGTAMQARQARTQRVNGLMRGGSESPHAAAIRQNGEVPVREVTTSDIAALRTHENVRVLAEGPHGAVVVSHEGQVAIMVPEGAHLTPEQSTALRNAASEHVAPGTGGRTHDAGESLGLTSEARAQVAVEPVDTGDVTVVLDPRPDGRITVRIGRNASAELIRLHTAEVNEAVRMQNGLHRGLRRLDAWLAPGHTPVDVTLRSILGDRPLVSGSPEYIRAREYLKYAAREEQLAAHLADAGHAATAGEVAEHARIVRIRETLGDPSLATRDLILSHDEISILGGSAELSDAVRRLPHLEHDASPAEIRAQAEAVSALAREHGARFSDVHSARELAAKYADGFRLQPDTLLLLRRPTVGGDRVRALRRSPAYRRIADTAVGTAVDPAAAAALRPGARGIRRSPAQLALDAHDLVIVRGGTPGTGNVASDQVNSSQAHYVEQYRNGRWCDLSSGHVTWRSVEPSRGANASEHYQFPADATVADAAARLRTTSLEPVERLAIQADSSNTLETLLSPEGPIEFRERTVKDVRHDVKTLLRPRIVEHFAPAGPEGEAGPAAAARARRYRVRARRALDALERGPDGSRDRARGLNSSDHGAVWEDLNSRLDAIRRGLDPNPEPHWTSTVVDETAGTGSAPLREYVTHLRIGLDTQRARANATRPVPGNASFDGRAAQIFRRLALGAEFPHTRVRFPDRFGMREGILRENKAIRGRLTTREQGQLAANLAMVERGLRFEVPAADGHPAVTLQVRQVVYDCVYGEGLMANERAFIHAMEISDRLVINVFNSNGERMQLSGEDGIARLGDRVRMNRWLAGGIKAW